MSNRNSSQGASAGTYFNPMVARPVDMLPDFIERRGVSLAQWTAIKNSLYPGSRDESIAAVLDYCTARGLDVFKRPCHIVPMKVKDPLTGAEVWRDVVMPGIYELRTTAMRTGEYVGQDPPVHGPETQHKGVTAPEWSEVTVWRLIKGEPRRFTHRARFAEECATKSDGSINAMWTKRPVGQLDKCAEAGALRKAFPEDLGGMMSAEEVDGKEIDMGAADVVERRPAARRTAARMDAAASRVNGQGAAAQEPAQDPQGERDDGGAADAEDDGALGPKEVQERIEAAQSFAELNAAVELIKDIPDEVARADLRKVQNRRGKELRAAQGGSADAG